MYVHFHLMYVTLKYQTMVNTVHVDHSTPLLEVFGWDKASTQIAISHTFGLPPCRVILTHHLQDVTSVERKSCFLAGCGLVFKWDVIKQGP